MYALRQMLGNLPGLWGRWSTTPHQFVAMIERGAVEEPLASQAIWRCLSCMACLERCPWGVEPARLVEAVRLMVIRQAGTITCCRPDPGAAG